MIAHLIFDQPEPPTGRIHALSRAAKIGAVYPLGDGRATWWCYVTEQRGEAKSAEAAKAALAGAFGQWMERAGVAQTAAIAEDQRELF
ncbi:hypothetical protein JJJ17_09240 [Paracoccus caeni]|uniref:Uncharacterized protein n=1 Tax=Paracoccus caeni TaxID=657651 RepID=A0A934W0A0_9RHOB|nr:hypothetical protein [Paracoccus caeni]MBK4216108.1 hypothetical protein [Paracoccus caeni]